MRNNEEFDPDDEDDEDMIIGFNRLVPLDDDARCNYLKTFPKEAVTYYNNNRYRNWPAFSMDNNLKIGKPGPQVTLYLDYVLEREETVLVGQGDIRKAFEIPALR